MRGATTACRRVGPFRRNRRMTPVSDTNVCCGIRPCTARFARVEYGVNACSCLSGVPASKRNAPCSISSRTAPMPFREIRPRRLSEKTDSFDRQGASCELLLSRFAWNLDRTCGPDDLSGFRIRAATTGVCCLDVVHIRRSRCGSACGAGAGHRAGTKDSVPKPPEYCLAIVDSSSCRVP